MMLKSIAFLSLAPSLVSAAGMSPAIFPRQLVRVPCSENGQKECGNGCIELSFSCCPDGGGCDPTTYCSLGDNGVYGCCAMDQVCVGPGGINSEINIETRVSTSTIEVTFTSTSISISTSVDTDVETFTSTITTTAATSDPVPSEETTTYATSNVTTTSSALPVFTGGADGSSGAAPIHALGVAIAALFVL